MDERKLKRMVKTIKRVNDRILKDEAREPASVRAATYGSTRSAVISPC
jgi:hypothetical protein